jgi:hypothetical protein
MRHLLSKEQKGIHVTISQDHYKRLEKYPEYLSLIIMGAEMLVCGYSAETLEF